MTVMTLHDYDEGHGPEIGASPRFIFCLTISMYLALMHPSIRLFLGYWPMHESFRELYPFASIFLSARPALAGAKARAITETKGKM